jgi:adenylyltransferase/sulfurtransferase
MKELSVLQLKHLLDRKESIHLLDVREADEFAMCHLQGAILIPLETLPTEFYRIPQTQPVVIYCHHGIRSAMAIEYLQKKHGFENLFILEGGIHAWAIEIDNQMLCY